MNGYTTRISLHRAAQESVQRETGKSADRIDAIIATLCCIGLVVIIVMQIAEKVVA